MYKRISKNFKQYMFNIIKIMAVSLLIINFASAITKAATTKLVPVTLVLDWAPNTNHTGLIVAKALGYYKEEGLDVTIIQVGKSSPEQLVARGLADFGISSSEHVVLAAEQQVPIISIAAILASNTSGFYSLKYKNITRPKDFEYKTYASWGSKVELATLQYAITKDGGDFNKIKIITGGDINFFKVKSLDFVWGYQAWTGIQAKIMNIPVNYIPIVKYRGVDDYSPIIITNSNFIKNNSSMVQKFINATRKGYNYTTVNPNISAQILLKAYPELNQQLIVASQNYITSSYKGKSQYWGEQKAEVWQNYINWLYNNKIITTKVNANKVFTNQFFNNK